MALRSWALTYLLWYTMEITSNVPTFATTNFPEMAPGAKAKSGAKRMKCGRPSGAPADDVGMANSLTSNEATFLGREAAASPVPRNDDDSEYGNFFSDAKHECPRDRPAAENHWWLSRSANLPPNRMNGWVVSMAMEEFVKEGEFAKASNKAGFATRMRDAGLAELVDSRGGPRRKCNTLAKAGSEKFQLLAEGGQREMLRSIAASIPAYCSGIRCWAAYCDAMGRSVHFPATEDLVIGFSSLFTNPQTYIQYVKHLRWAHTFLRLECVWYTKAVRQVERGAARTPVARLPKVAASTRQVHLMVKAAMTSGELEVAALMAVARQFLLRVPSEGIPLEWGGSHSHVSLEPSRAVLTLMSRKNSRVPVTLTRECCCMSSGERVCAVHWLHRLRCSSEGNGRVFSITKHYFARQIKELARQVGITEHARFGTHAFRRGMARDIVDHGGSLATLMEAGGWTSAAYKAYLRNAQVEDVSVTNTLIMLSDSDNE